jgi:hypothetical protein
MRGLQKAGDYTGGGSGREAAPRVGFDILRSLRGISRGAKIHACRDVYVDDVWHLVAGR